MLTFKLLRILQTLFLPYFALFYFYVCNRCTYFPFSLKTCKDIRGVLSLLHRTEQPNQNQPNKQIYFIFIVAF